MRLAFEAVVDPVDGRECNLVESLGRGVFDYLVETTFFLRVFELFFFYNFDLRAGARIEIIDA